MITIDFTKAQAITKERLRAERAPLLAAADVAFQRALEEGGDTAAVVAEKARLRDVTKLVDSCTALEELKALSCAVVEAVAKPVVEAVVESATDVIAEPSVEPASEGVA